VTNAVLSSPAWKAFRRHILERDGGRCQVNGPRCRGWATDVDHVIALADGGQPFDEANTRASCKPCNSSRSAERTNDIRRYRTGVAVYETRL
jgi:5-methylcytosine-specific restriction endonuclease McrA